MKKKAGFFLLVVIAGAIIYLTVSYIISIQAALTSGYWERRIESHTGLQTTVEEVTYTFPFTFELSAVELASPPPDDHHFSITTKKMDVAFSLLGAVGGSVKITSLSLKQPQVSKSDENWAEFREYLVSLFLENQVNRVVLSEGWLGDSYFQNLDFTINQESTISAKISDFRLNTGNFSGHVVYSPEVKEIYLEDFYFNFIDTGKILEYLPVEFFGLPLPGGGVLSGEIDRFKITEEQVDGRGKLRLQAGEESLSSLDSLSGNFSLDYKSNDEVELSFNDLLINNLVTPFKLELYAGREIKPTVQFKAATAEVKDWLALAELFADFSRRNLPEISGTVQPVNLTIPLERVETAQETIIIESPLIETEDIVFQSTTDTTAIVLNEGNLEIKPVELTSRERTLTVSGEMTGIFATAEEREQIEVVISSRGWPGATADYFLPAIVSWPTAWLPEGEIDLELIYQGRPAAVELAGEIHSNRVELAGIEVKNLTGSFFTESDDIVFSELTGEVFGGAFDCELTSIEPGYNLSGYSSRLNLEHTEDAWWRKIIEEGNLTTYFNLDMEPGEGILRNGRAHLFGWSFVFKPELRLEENLARVWNQVEQALVEAIEPGAGQEVFKQIDSIPGQNWSDLEGAVNIEAGVVYFDDLQLINETYELRISGEIDPHEELLSLEIEPRIAESLLEEIGGSMVGGVLSGPLPDFELRGGFDGLWQVNPDHYRQKLKDEFERRLEKLMEEDPGIIFREILG